MRGASFLSESGVALFPPHLGRDGRCADASAAIASPGYAEQPSVSRLSRGRQARLTFTVLWDVHRRAHLVVEETGPLPPVMSRRHGLNGRVRRGHCTSRAEEKREAEQSCGSLPSPVLLLSPARDRHGLGRHLYSLLVPPCWLLHLLARTSPPLGLFSFSAMESEQHCIWQHGLHLDWNPGSNAF